MYINTKQIIKGGQAPYLDDHPLIGPHLPAQRPAEGPDRDGPAHAGSLLDDGEEVLGTVHIIIIIIIYIIIIITIITIITWSPDTMCSTPHLSSYRVSVISTAMRAVIINRSCSN